MKKIIYIIIVSLLSSCSDFLEPKSQTEYVPRDLNSLNELLLGAAYIDPNNTIAPIFSYNEIFSDDLSCTRENCINTSNADRYRALKPYFAWHPEMFREAVNNNYHHNVWKSTYEKILGCNAVLDYVDKITGKADDANYVKGQAYALRALYYFNLVNLFGEPYNYNKNALGVPLKINSNMELSFPVRATVEEVYNQIDSDFDNAEKHFTELPLNKQFVRDGRVTLPMIQLMKARVALFKEEYEKCVIYSQKVINDWGLSLLDLTSFTPTPAQPYYNFVSYDNPEALWLYGEPNDFARFMFHTLYLLPTTTYQTRRVFNASVNLTNSFEAQDLRRTNYIVKESLTVQNYMPIGKTNVTTTYFLSTPSFGKALRLSEAYIMLAEANFKTNKFAEAITALEKVRAKRFSASSGESYKIPAQSRAGTPLLDFIKEERRREMCFDGLRWFDLRRWGMESFTRDWKEEGVIVNSFTMEKNDPAFTLPIPFDAIELNPNLVQNTLSNPKY